MNSLVNGAIDVLLARSALDKVTHALPNAFERLGVGKEVYVIRRIDTRTANNPKRPVTRSSVLSGSTVRNR